MHQPDIEDIAERRLRAADGRVLRFDHELVGLEQTADAVSLRFEHRAHPGKTTRVRARYVIGADSANSAVRELCGITSHDAGFAYDWLVVDLLPTPAGHAVLAKHGYYQACDPRRPLTCVWSGPGRRRFEFMRLPGEDAQELASDRSVWALLAPFGIHDGNCTVERSAVYTFRARLADTFARGRCALVGDAAHLTPPFLGQGLQMGMRDVANLAWRLPLMLDGRASPERMLDAYSAERRAPCRFLIDLAVELGKVICVETADDAERVHAAFRRRASGQIGSPPLGAPGTVVEGHPLAGHISLHRRVRDAQSGAVRHLDDITGGRGWRLLAWRAAPVAGPHWRQLAATLGVDVYVLLEDDDVTGEYAQWFSDDVRGDWALCRPDFYVAAAGAGADELERVAMALLQLLS